MGEPNEDPREKQNKLIERLGTALLGLKASIDKLVITNAEAHSAQISVGNAHLTQLGLLNKALEDLDKLAELGRLLQAIEELRRMFERAAERTERSLDGLRDDLTPTHGTPLPSKEELDRALKERGEELEAQAKVKIGPVTVRERLLARLADGLPYLMVGLALGLIAVIYLLAKQGEGLGVVKLPERAAPALGVPKLEIDKPPHEP